MTVVIHSDTTDTATTDNEMLRSGGAWQTARSRCWMHRETEESGGLIRRMASQVVP